MLVVNTYCPFNNCFPHLSIGTIVENSSHGLNRNVEYYKTLSKASGVHVVAGTGYYIADVQADDTLHSTQEEIYDLMLKEVTEGCVDCPDVKAGFLGEIASVWPLKGRQIILAHKYTKMYSYGMNFSSTDGQIRK